MQLWFADNHYVGQAGGVVSVDLDSRHMSNIFYYIHKNLKEPYKKRSFFLLNGFLRFVVLEFRQN